MSFSVGETLERCLGWRLEDITLNWSYKILTCEKLYTMCVRTLILCKYFKSCHETAGKTTKVYLKKVFILKSKYVCDWEFGKMWLKYLNCFSVFVCVNNHTHWPAGSAPPLCLQ